MKTSHLKKHIWCGVMIILIIAFDQITKYLSLTYLRGKEPVIFIPKIVQFCYVENTGMAFSLLSGARWVFIALTVCFCGFGMWYIFSNRCKNLWAYWSVGVIVSGGIGNLIDRVRLSYVIDFIEPIFVNFAVFNIADCAVVLGSYSLILYLIFDLVKGGEKNGG